MAQLGVETPSGNGAVDIDGACHICGAVNVIWSDSLSCKYPDEMTEEEYKEATALEATARDSKELQHGERLNKRLGRASME